MPGRPSLSMLATQSPAIFWTPGLFFHFSRSSAEKSTMMTPLPFRYFWNLSVVVLHRLGFPPAGLVGLVENDLLVFLRETESHFLWLMVNMVTPAMQPISIRLMYLATS